MAESKYYGIYQGIITNILDPEKRGRIRVKCPDVLGAETMSAWCEPCVPVAYDNGGDLCIPSIDETTFIMFIGGDVNKPVYLGNWWKMNTTPVGINYVDVDKLRIISYADTKITMQNGVININVGAGICDLQIADGKVVVKGDLEVDGNITATTVVASGVSLTTHTHGGVESGSDSTSSPK